MKMKGERQKEDGRSKIFKIWIFFLSFFSFGHSTNFIFWF